MTLTHPLDCLILGYHEVSFEELWRQATEFEGVSGYVQFLMTGSVLYQNRRITYHELFDEWRMRHTGQPSRVHVHHLPNLAVCYLRNYLMQRGFAVDYVNFVTHEWDRTIALLKTKPRAVAITTTFYLENTPIRELVALIREHCPETTIILGGPHIYNVRWMYRDQPKMQEVFLDELGGDLYVYDSQGEGTLARILKVLRETAYPNYRRIPNLLYRDGGRLHETTSEPENNSMDEVTIDWRTFPRDFLKAGVSMRTARSCAYKCAFCTYPSFAGALNVTSVEKVEEEMEGIAEQDCRHLLFIDDTFNVPLPRFKQLCRMMIRRRFNFTWFSYFRCSNADEETFDLMKAAGCMGVFLGIESGDQTILNNMNKHVTVDRYQEGIRQLKARDILTFASFIVGFPGETEETARNTINFLLETQPTFFRAELYYHFPLAPIHARAQEFGIRGGGFSWSHHTMNWWEACALQRELCERVNESLLLPHSFDFWVIPYLLDQGVTIPELQTFLAEAKPLLLQDWTLPTH